MFTAAAGAARLAARRAVSSAASSSVRAAAAAAPMGASSSSSWDSMKSTGKMRFSTQSSAGDTPATLGSHDHYFEKSRIPKGDPNRREFTYFVLGAGRFIYASAARLILIRFVASMSAADDVLALANTEVDISGIAAGQGITIKWRGKPVFIRRRTDEEIKREQGVSLGDLRDEELDDDRTLKPEWLVVLGICTHLGCVPISNAGEYHGWFCPCHGSHYDLSGRIRKGPAPLNLEVPPYSFMDEGKIVIG